MIRVSSEFAARLKNENGFNAGACFHCGTCAALCPLGYKILPRKLFREVMLGLEDRLRDNMTEIYSCLLCRMCEVNCPSGVHIAENMRTLRHLLNRREFGLK
jgi:heterodisulfide reductase subunit C2